MDSNYSRYASYPSLAGRVVFVTGGATGIGASLVEHFCAQQARVSFVDIAEAPARELIEGIRRRGHPAPAFISCDLRDIEALRAAIGAASKKDGPIRVLVNNAANDDRHRLEDVTVDYWDNRIAVNLRHQFFAAQAVRADMRDAGGGSIVNFSSITWLVGFDGLPVYVAAKAAVTGMTRALARELGQEKIRVNSVTPGWIMTERQVQKWMTPAGEKMREERQCLKDRLYPHDVARMVLFLAADDSAMCTSQNYVVDGGWA